MNCSLLVLLSFIISRSLLQLMSLESVMPPNHLILSSRSPPAFNLSQRQGLFRWVSSLHQVAKVLELQHQSFQWIFRVDFLLDWVAWSCSPRDSQESFPTPLIVVGNLELSNCRNYYTYLEQASVANLFPISVIKYTDALEAEAPLVGHYFPCLCGLEQAT